MPTDDFTLTIEDVAKRLSKSVRTIHRYKDSGRLAFVVGPTQGNPLFFSKQETESLFRELYPNLVTAGAPPPVDPQFWDRLERVERLLTVLEHNPLLEQVLTLAGGRSQDRQRQEIESLIQRLAPSGGDTGRLDNKELGRLLVRLGTMLQED